MFISSALILAAFFAAPSNAAVNFCGPTNATCFFEPTFTDLGSNLNITAKIGGVPGNIIRYGGSVDFYAKGIGFLDEVCYNGGVTAAPGQNKDATTEGAQEKNLNEANNGSIETFIATESSCDCGLDTGSYYDKKTKITFHCPDDGLTGGEDCCTTADPNDFPVTCPADCTNCRVNPHFKSCPNNSAKWDQYVIGTKFLRVVVDAALKDVAGTILQIQRQECFIVDSAGSPLPEGSADGGNDIKCYQCDICSNQGSEGACQSTYQLSAPSLDTGCDGKTATET